MKVTEEDMRVRKYRAEYGTEVELIKEKNRYRVRVQVDTEGVSRRLVGVLEILYGVSLALTTIAHQIHMSKDEVEKW